MFHEYWLNYVPDRWPQATSPETFNASDYTDVALLHNPASSQAHKTPKVIEKLQQAKDQFGLTLLPPLETSPDSAENTATLRENVGPGTIVVVQAGDGGTSKVLSAVRAAELLNPVLVLGGGRKDDIAHQLFPKRYSRQPVRALAKAAMRTVRPMVAEFTQADGRHMSLDAFGYVSTGVTSAVATEVNSTKYRAARTHDRPGERFIAERALAIRAFMHARTFSYAENAGRMRRAVDVIASNGSRMAGEFHPRANLFEPGFRLVTVRNKLSGVAILGALKARLPVGTHRGPGELLDLQLEVAPTSCVQIDGEEYPLAEETTLNLRVADSGVQLLTSRY